MSDLQKLIDEAKKRFEDMTADDREEMLKQQRASFVRGLTTPCKHGILDFEQCADCRKGDVE